MAVVLVQYTRWLGLVSLDDKRTDFLSFPCQLPHVPQKLPKAFKRPHFVPKMLFARTRRYQVGAYMPGNTTINVLVDSYFLVLCW